jgi:hypothetical protein
MSLRQWNTLSERIRFQKHIKLSYCLLLFKIAVGDDDDDHMSISSSDSDLSQSSADTVDLLITDMSDSDCINDLRFCKIHLEIVAQMLCL